jgi:CubicO group peptidase (beta-lactamase class C family)
VSAGTTPQTSIDKAKALKSTVDGAVGDYLNRPKVKGKFVGMVVGVITGNDRHQYYYGETVKGNTKAPVHDTLFAIGSVSKTFTATLLALYNHRGLVRIPRPPLIGGLSDGTQQAGTSGPSHPVSTQTKLRDLLPAQYGLASQSRNITVEQLADHHSGLPKNPMEVSMKPRKKSTRKVCTTGSPAGDIDCMLKQLATCEPDADPRKNCHAPIPLSGVGDGDDYSNYAFAILSHLLARFHEPNATWIEALRGEILGPLGMQATNDRAAFLDTACYTGPCDYAKYGECNYKGACNETFSKRAAVGYVVDDVSGKLKPAPDQGSDEAVKGGSGVLWSTLDDQMIWLQYNMGLKTLIRWGYRTREQEMIDILPELQAARDGTYGLAWKTENWDGAKVIGKGGSASGFHAYIGFNPSRGTGVVVLANCALEPDVVARKILAVL